MKKSRKKWITFKFEATETEESTLKDTNITQRNCSPDIKESSSCNLRELNCTDFKRSANFNVLEKLKPVSVDELAVHPKKINEVEHWLTENVLSVPKLDTPILLLSGPTGSGKTATINVLCKKLNINIFEWINSVDQNFEAGFHRNQIELFLDFFMQSKYTSLCDTSNGKKIILVEDFPNFVTFNPKQFIEILERCCCSNTPTVFICSDASNNKINLSHTLFPEDVRDRFCIANISFNPSSDTLLRNLLKKASTLTKQYSDIYRSISVDVTNAIISSSMGDIRCVINQYQFSCLQGLQDISTTTNSTKKRKISKRKRNDNNPLSISSMVKNETLSFFHGLGRVLNPKRIEVANSWRIQCDFDSLIDQFSTQPSMFNNFLQENYLKYFGNFCDVQKASDVLSQTQVFLEKWTDRHEILLYGLWLSVLGLMIFNEHRVSKWTQIKAPTKKTDIRKEYLIEMENINVTELTYYNVILNRKQQSRFKF